MNRTTPTNRTRFAILAGVMLLVVPLRDGFGQYTATPERAQAVLAAFEAGGDDAVKCGTTRLQYLRTVSGQLLADERTRLKSLSARPILPESYVSSSGRFRIHYSTAPGSIDRVDATSTNPDGVPDWVYEAALAADQAHELLVDTWGFRLPVGDNGVGGPEFDFYIIDLANKYGTATYGVTTSETIVNGGFSAFIEVENDFSGGFFTRGLAALQVTVAHEYFHAVQFAYGFRSEDIFFYEMSSTWFEDEAYNDVNDYLQYVPVLMRQLDRPLHTANGLHEYGASLFLKYWLDDRDPSSLERMWAGTSNILALDAIQAEIVASGLSMEQAVSEFYTWCLFTGDRADESSYFDEGSQYPAVRLTFRGTIAADTTLTGFMRPLSAKFYDLDVDRVRAFSAQLNSAAPNAFRLVALPQNAAGQLGRAVFRAGSTPLSLPSSQHDGRLQVAVVNGSVPADASTSPDALLNVEYELGLFLRELEAPEAGLQRLRPNPFVLGGTNALLIGYTLPELGDVTIAVHNEAGQRVFEEKRSNRQSGEVVWRGLTEDGDPVAAGVYFVVLQSAGGLRDVGKVAVVR